VRDPQGPEDTPEKLEAERQAEQELIDNGELAHSCLSCANAMTAEPLTEEELAEKEALVAQGFEDWSRRDFQQFVRALESYGWTEDFELLATDIQDKTPDDVARYYPVFKKKWKTLAEHARIAARIAEGEAKRDRRSNLEKLLAEKIASVRYPMQELELNYPTTKGKVYSEEEDRYLLCRLNHYGMSSEDVYDRIKKDITEFPVFRFDWFFKSRSPQELARRCNTLLSMIEKEAMEARAQEEATRAVKSSTRGKKRNIEDVAKAPSPTPSGSTVAAAPAKRQYKKKKT